jgi:hypothetical protein
MRQLLLLSVLLSILISCTLTAATQTPEAIHARWVAAIRANDRAAALAVVSADLSQREVFVDQTLHTMQDLMTTPSSPTGSLQGVDTLAPTDQGQAKRAISVWHFAKKTWCYAADLTATEEGWRVGDWGQIAHCP